MAQAGNCWRALGALLLAAWLAPAALGQRFIAVDKEGKPIPPAAALSPAQAAPLAGDGLQEILYVPFEGNCDAVIARGSSRSYPAVSGYEAGVVGQAARSNRIYTGIRWDGRGNIDLDRGTIAFFLKTNADVKEDEWGSYGGVMSDIEGYWSGVMEFHQIAQTFHLQFFDVGRYARRLEYPPIVGRWKKDQWHHLAAVWDRYEGLKIYEDGKLAASNWGQYRWQWNHVPRVLFLGHNIYSTVDFSADELHVYGQCLSDEQIAALAKGQKPSGPPLALSAPETRREADLARMGWRAQDLKELPQASAGKPLAFTYAQIDRLIDAKRQVGQAAEGLLDSCWPLSKYGASVSGKVLEVYFRPGQQYDRVRIFAQRPTAGAVSQLDPVHGLTPLVTVDAQTPIWRGRLDKLRSDGAIYLQRERGVIGAVDFFRVESAGKLPKEDKKLTYVTSKRLAHTPTTEAGRAIMGDVPVRYDCPVAATTKGESSWKLNSPALGGFQLISEDLPGELPVDGVVVHLTTEQLTQPTPVQILVKEPLWPQRIWMSADVLLMPDGKSAQDFTFVLRGRPVVTPLPGFRLRRGNSLIEQEPVQLAVLVTAGNDVTWRMGKGGTRVALIQADMKQAKPLCVADQIEYCREAYAEANEGHIYDGHPFIMWARLGMPLLYLMQAAPEARPVMAMATAVGWRTDDLPYHPPANELKAPDWAFWQIQALRENKRILHWIIDNRQIANGEFGGVYGDDTDMVENWVDFALMGDDDRKIGDALRRIYAGLWQYNLTDGVSASIRDALHSYEEGMGTIAQQLVIDYGNPTAIEHTMRAASHYPQWMKQNADGSYTFRSWYLGASGVWEQGDFGKDKPINGLMFLPASYLIWYNHHPTPAKYLLGWKEFNQGGGMVTDTVYELLPEKDKQAFRDGWYTEQADSLIKGRRYGMTANAILDEIPLKPEWVDGLKGMAQWTAVPSSAQMALHLTESFACLYKATGDVKHLTDSYQASCRLINNLEWLYTVAQPSTDRIPPPHTTLSRARLGAIAVNRGGNGNFWPRHGISYISGSDNVAALVTDNGYQSFAARFWSFAAGEQPMQVRLWRLWPGRYQLTLAHDANNDGQAEGAITQSEVAIQRGCTLTLNLPPRQGVIFALKAIAAAPPTFDKPDPAIGPEDVRLEFASGHLKVRVHNVGTQPTRNVTVRVYDGSSGVLVAQETAPVIDPPLDMQPRYVDLEFHNVDCITYRSVVVKLDPGSKPEDDLNPYNNEASCSN